MVTLGEGGTVVALGRGPMHQTLLQWCLTRDITAVIPYRVIYDFIDTKSAKFVELVIITTTNSNFAKQYRSNSGHKCCRC